MAILEEESMNYGEMDPGNRSAAEREVILRTDGLKSIQRNLAISITKYMITANAGGAVAVLAYVHANTSQPISIYIKLSLVSFILGILSISVALMWLYRRTWKIEGQYIEDTKLFFKNQISLLELRRRDNERCESDKVEHSLGGFFIFGLCYGRGSWRPQLFLKPLRGPVVVAGDLLS